MPLGAGGGGAEPGKGRNAPGSAAGMGRGATGQPLGRERGCGEDLEVDVPGESAGKKVLGG